jgi:hypothetical protein
VTNTSGTSTVNGVTTTVTSVGSVSSFTPCGPTNGPYYLPSQGEAYNYTFSPAVSGVNVPVVFALGGTPGATHFKINGTNAILTNANLKGTAPSSCSPGVLATVLNGDLSNIYNQNLDPNALVKLPVTGTISSLNISSDSSDGFINGLFITKGATPSLSFNNLSNQTLNLCPNTAATSINALLAVTSLNTGLILNWTTVVNPLHGTLTLGGSQTSTGASLTPTGFTYQPTSGFTGTDGFTIQVSDGINIVASSSIDCWWIIRFSVCHCQNFQGYEF